jgi:hypothetical protein
MERKSGLALIAGGSVLAVGGVVTQVVQASTTVSDQQWSYPWSSSAAAAISAVWAVAQALLVFGLVGLRRSGVAGPGRAAVVGPALAIAGTALILGGHLASIPVSDQTLDDAGPQAAGALFGLGTLLTAAGMLAAGRATLHAGVWHDWRRFTPIATGVWSVALLGLQFTKALPTAAAVFALCFVLLGAALVGRRAPATAAAPQVQGA